MGMFNRAVTLALLLCFSTAGPSLGAKDDKQSSQAQQFGMEEIPAMPPPLLAFPKSHFRPYNLPKAAKKIPDPAVVPVAAVQKEPRLTAQAPHAPAWTSPVQLGRIVVSARRAATVSDQLSENVAVITEEEIDDLPASDAGEVLSYVPGVDMDTRTKFGHFRPLSLQGSESRHVLVMVDGIPFNTQLSGQADILPALPVNNIRQMEIVKGAASSVWGSSLGGVVNILTKEPGDFVTPKRIVSTKFSGHGGQAQELEWGGHAGGVGYYLSASLLNSEGARFDPSTPNREDTSNKKFFGKIETHLTDVLKATTSFGYTGAEVHEGVYPTAPVWSEMPYYARYGQVQLTCDPNENQIFEAAFKMNRQLIQSDTLLDPTDDLLSSVRSTDHYYGIELKSRTLWGENSSLNAGYDISTHILKTTLMAQSRDLLLQAPYANYQLTIKPLTLNAGIRYDDNEEFGQQLSPSAGLVLELPFLPKTLLRANASKGFSAPPLLWKYFEDIVPGLTANNPDLRPERAKVYELGVESRAIPGTWFKLSVYQSDVYDAIATTLDSEGRFIKQNFDEFRQRGIELDSKLTLSREIAFVFAAGFNDVKDRLTEETVRGRGVARPAFRLGLDYEHASGFKAGIWGNYNRWDSLPESEPNDRKFIFDAKVGHTFSKLLFLSNATLSVSVYNLTNSKYWSNREFPLPQRYFEGGVALEF
jgi:vitamin B12 transporter